MSDARAKELIDLGDRLFSKRQSLLGLWQELAENFYPERADFFGQNMVGMDFNSINMDSFPIMLRRELADSLAAMLRPKDQEWFKVSTLVDEVDNKPENARSLQYLAQVTKRGMYDPRTKFIRATKMGDNDWACFGQTVLSVEESTEREHLFYRAHHLRDCAWLENALGDVDHLHRKDMMTARTLRTQFREAKLDTTIKRAAEKEPYKEFPIRCVVLPSDEYDMSAGKSKRGGRKLPFVAVYLDMTNCKIIDEYGLHDFIYVVPRWQMISGSQYAFSPATMTALPDGRMMQMMAKILMESGEKAVDPPMVAQEEAIREVNTAAGAITWVDASYDGKIKEAMYPIETDHNMQVGFAMRQDLREMLTKEFFLDRLRLPDSGKVETATEIRARLQEHIRNLLPLFEPVQVEYNTKICEKTLTALRNMGKIDPDMISDDLSGGDVSFKFQSPIEASSDRQLVAMFQEALQIEAGATQVGVNAPRANFSTARDDALRGAGVPAKWLFTDEEMNAMAQQAMIKQQIAGAAQEVATGADVTSKVADASMKVGQAMQPPQQQQLPLPAPPKQALLAATARGASLLPPPQQTAVPPPA